MKKYSKKQGSNLSRGKSKKTMSIFKSARKDMKMKKIFFYDNKTIHKKTKIRA
jgi:hypothetical protein